MLQHGLFKFDESIEDYAKVAYTCQLGKSLLEDFPSLTELAQSSVIVSKEDPEFASLLRVESNGVS